jgi:hypothetical protein
MQNSAKPSSVTCAACLGVDGIALAVLRKALLRCLQVECDSVRAGKRSEYGDKGCGSRNGRLSSSGSRSPRDFKLMISS